MAAIKALNTIRDKWEGNAGSSSAQQAYSSGVSSPRRDWEESTVAAEESYNSGVQSAIERGAFGEGARSAGTAKWQSRSKELGASRLRQGVRAAGGDFESGFRPFHERIAQTSLPPRGPKGDPNNIERVRVIAEALHNEKIGA